MTKISVTLRLRSQSLDPDAISAKLGTTPSHAHRAGAINRGRDGREYAPFTEGLWSMDSKVGPTEPLSSHVRDVFDNVQPALVQALLDEGLYADLFVGVFLTDDDPIGIMLDGAALGLIAQSGVILDVAIYPIWE
jgi:Domain of unknown function (DUF4279)